MSPGDAELLEEVRAGLRRSPKELPCKLLYDAAGSALFERICALPEYYPTRTELAIMRAHVGAMAQRLGPRCRLVELGSGASVKSRLLLSALEDPAEYLPVDISPAALQRSTAAIEASYPGLVVHPVCADYTRPFELPDPDPRSGRTAVYFPGSTVGNFHPGEAAAFLSRFSRYVGTGGLLLIGVDLEKDPATLEAAYDDAQGVTAAFNRNILRHLSRRLGAGLDPAKFDHRAVYRRDLHRVEMHLVAREPCSAHLAGETIPIVEGEVLVTEYSYKYSLESFARLAREAGFQVAQVWTDPEALFSVQLLIAEEHPRKRIPPGIAARVR